MTRLRIELPDAVRARALACGAAKWLTELPELVGSLESEWSISAGRSLTGGTEALVVEVLQADATPAVLKLLVPHDESAPRYEATVLRLAAGQGCPRLFRDDPARGALLMERLGVSLFDLALPIEQREAILCDAARRIWRPAPGSGLPTGADKGRWLIETIVARWDELDRPCSERAVDHALACARRRIAAHDDQRAVLVHGDVHQWNALSSRDGFKLVDPDGLLAEAEYDLGILMREDPLELLGEGEPFDRAHRLAARTGLDATAIWEWGVVERVSTGLLATKIELQPVGREMLAVADRIAEATRY